MNFLAHLHLGGERPGQLLGSLYGDFVKGPLQDRWPTDIEAGIRLHRQIDVFTDSHPVVLQAKQRFPRERRRYAGILVDLFFDHCLAAHWHDYASEPLHDFTARVYQVLREEAELPAKLALIAPRMAAQDWLGAIELEQLYTPLLQDFRDFYPQLHAFASARIISPADAYRQS